MKKILALVMALTMIFALTAVSASADDAIVLKIGVSTAETDPRNIAAQQFPAIVFVGFIAVMLVLLIVMPKKDFSVNEKRNLQQAPAFSFASFFSKEKTFENQFENFISDQTPGRDFWVGFNSSFCKILGNTAPKGVYYGKDGYLINDPTETKQLSRNFRIICRSSSLFRRLQLSPGI